MTCNTDFFGPSAEKADLETKVTLKSVVVEYSFSDMGKHNILAFANSLSFSAKKGQMPLMDTSSGFEALPQNGFEAHSNIMGSSPTEWELRV